MCGREDRFSKLPFPMPMGGTLNMTSVCSNPMIMIIAIAQNAVGEKIGSVNCLSPCPWGVH